MSSIAKRLVLLAAGLSLAACAPSGSPARATVVAPSSSPAALFYVAAPLNRDEAALVKGLAERLEKRGIRYSWAWAGSPSAGLRNAAADLPALADEVKPAVVVVFFSQLGAADDFFFESSRSLPPLARTIAYEWKKLSFFRGQGPLDGELVFGVSDHLVARLSGIQRELAARKIPVYFVSDGKTVQLPAPRNFLLPERFRRAGESLYPPRGIRMLEALPILARKAGVDLQSSPALAEALLTPGSSSAAVAEDLLAILLANRLGPAAKN